MTSQPTTAPSSTMRRRRGMTEEAAEAAVDQACRALRLPTVRSRVAEMLTAAEKEQLTYRGFLAELLLAECDDRARRRSARRVKAAGFPREKWLGDFDFDANPNVNAATIHQLATAAWVRASVVPDRGLRHRQVPPPHRARHVRGRGGVPGEVHPGHQAAQRTRRGCG